MDDQIDLESDLCVQIVLFCFPDDMARYSYKAQPEICKWNLIKLAEAMADVLPIAKSRILLEDVYVYLTSICKRITSEERRLSVQWALREGGGVLRAGGGSIPIIVAISVQH